MSRLTSYSLPIGGLLLLFMSLTNGEFPSAFYYLQPNYYPRHYFPYSFFPQSIAAIYTVDQVEEVIATNNNVDKPTKRLFGLALSSLFGQQNRPGRCPVCPTCPAITQSTTCPVITPSTTCPAITQSTTCPAPIPPASIVVPSATSCPTFLLISPCSSASAAPSGTFTVTYPVAIVGNAVLTIVPTPPNTKVRIICPNLIGGVAAATPTGPLVANTARIDSGYSSIIFSGTPGLGVALPATAVCTWTSIP